MTNYSESIDVLRITGAKRIQSQSGRDTIVIDVATSNLKPHKNGCVYLNMFVRETGENKFGNTHMVTEDLSREERDSGKKGAILGNLKPIVPKAGFGNQQQKPQKPWQKQQQSHHDSGPINHMADDDIPF